MIATRLEQLHGPRFAPFTAPAWFRDRLAALLSPHDRQTQLAMLDQRPLELPRTVEQAVSVAGCSRLFQRWGTYGQSLIVEPRCEWSHEFEELDTLIELARRLPCWLGAIPGDFWQSQRACLHVLNPRTNRPKITRPPFPTRRFSASYPWTAL